MFLEDLPISYPGRCDDCMMQKDLCICSQFKAFPNKVKVTLIMHHRERYKTTNTGRIAHKALNNSQVLLRGLPGTRLELCQHVKTPRQCLFLYPHEKSLPLTEFSKEELSRFSELVVPDGTWGQARKLSTREPLIQSMTWVRLESPKPSRYFLRKEPQPYGMATLEAIAQALGAIEGPDVQNYLEGLLETMVEKTLATRPPNRAILNRLEVFDSHHHAAPH